MGRKLDVGYIIIQHMLIALDSKSCSLPYSSNITCLLKHFNVHITETPLDESKELEQENITNLGFKWNVNYDKGVKNQNLKNKPTEMASTDDQIFNDVIPP